MDWQTAGILLSRVRDQVNDMSKLLFQLRENQAEASPTDRKEIKRIVPTVLELTNTTQAALVTLSNNEGNLYLSDLPGLARDIYNQAGRINRTTENFEHHANARHEVSHLAQTLQINRNS
jgi:alpha-D-ribose 1-methylphosphonate 5-triphosphate synthase subunit PhnH